MLKTLRIRNIGLIDDLQAEFGPGLNVLTGETGAGKSMILSALNLLLGERADYGLLKKADRDGSAECRFDASALPERIEAFEQEAIEPEEGEYIIKRILQKTGKSRALVNGSMLTLNALQAAGQAMVDIHGQHEHQALLRKETHLPWLDHFLNLTGERREASRLLEQLKETRAALAEKLDAIREAEAKREFLEFKANEIEKADLKENEEEELEKEQKILANAEKIMEQSARLFNSVYEDEGSANNVLGEAVDELEKLKEKDPFFEKYAVLFADMAAQLSDAAMEIQSYATGIESDPNRLEELEERISLLEKLKRKYHTDLPGLMQAAEEAREELDGIEHADDEIKALQETEKNLAEELTGKAAALHRKRMKGKEKFKKAVEEELKGLNMGQARFDVEVTLPETDPDGMLPLDGKGTKIFSHGFGDFRFLISTNPGQEPKPLTKVASGGEISRVMLALKTATGKTQPVPVLVFDEIDTGIGGKTADMVGEKLKTLSKSCQIFCITHLPQIARQADRHYVVEKKAGKDDTEVSIRPLSDDERVEELARMQAGKEITEAARQHAREMINR